MRKRNKRDEHDARWPLAHQAYQRLKRGQADLRTLPDEERHQLLALWRHLYAHEGEQGRATLKQKLAALNPAIRSVIETILATTGPET